MLRVPSSIQPNQFEMLSIRRPDESRSDGLRSDGSRSDGSAMTFVAYRSDVYPERNEIFFEEHAVVVVLEGEKKFSSPTQELHVHKGQILFFQRGCYSMNESIDANYRSLVFFMNEKMLKEFVGQHLSLFQNTPAPPPADLILSFRASPTFVTFYPVAATLFRGKLAVFDRDTATQIPGITAPPPRTRRRYQPRQTITDYPAPDLSWPENRPRLPDEHVPAQATLHERVSTTIGPEPVGLQARFRGTFSYPPWPMDPS